MLNKLIDIYNNWGEKNNLEPLGSADEAILREDISFKQRKWLEKFIEVWDFQEEVDHFIEEYEKTKKLKKYEVIFSKKGETKIIKRIIDVDSILNLHKEVDSLKSEMELENEHILEIKEVA